MKYRRTIREDRDDPRGMASPRAPYPCNGVGMSAGSNAVALRIDPYLVSTCERQRQSTYGERSRRGFSPTARTTSALSPREAGVVASYTESPSLFGAGGSYRMPSRHETAALGWWWYLISSWLPPIAQSRTTPRTPRKRKSRSCLSSNQVCPSLRHKAHQSVGQSRLYLQQTSTHLIGGLRGGFREARKPPRQVACRYWRGCLRVLFWTGAPGRRSVAIVTRIKSSSGRAWRLNP